MPENIEGNSLRVVLFNRLYIVLLCLFLQFSEIFAKEPNLKGLKYLDENFPFRYNGFLAKLASHSSKSHAINNSFFFNISTQNPLNSTYIKVSQEKYYKTCFITSAEWSIYFWRKCWEMEMDEKFFYNCDEAKYKELSANPKIEKGILIKNALLPIDSIINLLQESKCSEVDFTMENELKVKFLSDNSMRIRVTSGFFEDYSKFKYKRFYEVSESLFQFNPLGNRISLGLVITQINLSQRLYVESLNAGKEEKEKKDAQLIDLDSNGDLSIDKAMVFLDTIITNVYHEILYICAKNKNNGKAYHFIIDRSARDPTHELSTWEHAVENLIEWNIVKTLIRVIYYKRSENCNEEDMPDSKHFNPNLFLMKLGKNQYDKLAELSNYLNNQTRTELFQPSEPVSMKVIKEKNSFKKLLTAVQRYALRYHNYDVFNSCQHFATGFFNYLTDQNETGVNKYLVDKISFAGNHVSKDPFSNYFTDETDEEFEIVNNQRIIKNE